MNGLQAIQDRILSEAQEKADQIARQAQAGYEEITAAARQESEQLLAAARQSAAKQAEALLNRARSAAALDSRKKTLQARQDLIDQVLARSIELLCQLPDDRKIVLYQHLLQRTQVTDGEITFAAADRHLASRVLEGAADHYTIADTAGSFAGGLVLRRGLIEDNLTFDRLAATNRSQLVQVAAAALAGLPDQPAAVL